MESAQLHFYIFSVKISCVKSVMGDDKLYNRFYKCVVLGYLWIQFWYFALLCCPPLFM